MMINDVMARMYDTLAHLYDWPGGQDVSRWMADRGLAVLKEQTVLPPAAILDLACGTGDLSIAMAKAGYDVTGLDQSEAMLSVAKQKPGADCVNWIMASMAAFTLPNKVSTVLCHDDSVNHLLCEADLNACLASVCNALDTGGLFLFDTNTLENYQHFWQGKDVYEGPNYRLTMTSQFDGATGRATVNYCAQEHQATAEDTVATLVEREETVEEQYYPSDTIAKLLKDAGFEVLQSDEIQPVAELPDDMMLKTYWVCRKK